MNDVSIILVDESAVIDTLGIGGGVCEGGGGRAGPVFIVVVNEGSKAPAEI